MSHGARNLAASVRQKLKNEANRNNRPFAELLQYYAMERFLYRLTQSSHADRFILKGALMLRAWNSPEIRPTMDIDLLGKTSNEIDSICSQISDIIQIEIDDGLIFHADTIKGQRIKDEASYEGVRVLFKGALDTAKIYMQIDIGFGDTVYPTPSWIELPTILDFPAPKLLGYSRESVIAEKFEAMINLGALNSRMKDFYDIWLLSRQYEFPADNLAEAIRVTLHNRGTELPDIITAFTENYGRSKQKNWAAFCKRLVHSHVPTNFMELVEHLDDFLSPISNALKHHTKLPVTWSPTRKWYYE